MVVIEIMASSLYELYKPQIIDMMILVDSGVMRVGLSGQSQPLKPLDKLALQGAQDYLTLNLESPQ